MKENINFAVRVFRKYMFYLTSQKWDRKQIESYQDKQLIRIVKHAAKNVPYYRNIFREIGFDPYTFRGRADMHNIPLLDKETLRTRQNEFIAENAIKYGINWDSTSGSTGTPLHFILDHSTKAHKLAAVLRSYQWAGYVPGKKTFSIQSYTFENPNSIFKHYGFANLWRFDAKKLKKDTAVKIIKMTNKIKPRIFIGYPFAIFMLSRLAEEEGTSVQPIESIVTAGETLSERRRELLEAAYGCKVFDFYSLHEDIAMISECRNHTKHLCEDFAYHEIVDESGNDASKNEIGELVGTGFYNYAMPLIRYKIDDTVVLDNEDSTCKCGRKFKVVKEIIGRQNDYIVMPDGRLLGNVLEHAIDKAKGVMLSQCVQDAVDHIYINLIIDKTFNENSTKALEKGLRQRLDDEIKIDFRFVDHLERKKSGKTPFMISKIGHEYI